MDDSSQVNRTELSAHGQSKSTSMAELMDVLERTMNDACQIENRTLPAPILRDIVIHMASASVILNRISNLHTPIGRLPNEVVAQILLATLSAIRGNGHLIDPCRWEHLMRVCSRWTSIIREDSRFWTSINFAWNRATIERYLSLCKGSLLSLQMPPCTDFLREHKNLLLLNMGRAKEIKIVTSDYQSGDCLHTEPSFMFTPNPPIASLTIDTLGMTQAEFRDIHCPAELLIASMPNLTDLSVHCPHSTAPTHSLPPLQHLSSLASLELYDCRLEEEWNRIFPASLRHLRLAYPAYQYPGSKPGVNIINIIHLVTQCPSLESLDIAGASITRAPQALHPQGTIIAQQLRRLVVSDMSSESNLLFHYIQAPMLSKVHHTIPFKRRIPSLPAYLANCMAQASHAAIEFRYSHITYTYSGMQTPQDVTFEHVLSIICEPKFHDPVRFRNVKTDWTQVIDQTMTQFAKLECLTIELDHWHEMGFQWCTLPANMNSLVSLDLQGIIGEEFFKTLSSIGFCPRLLSLCIRTPNYMRTETVNIMS
ncbi:hypothetical protein SISNIDRAFT_489021 [Sistotremastrum niveocremeum HHB9708]|uniref:F-box domain-containing protein n=1 Tax=Sistotremastrum niveocremeum HHB9708 TaxID=1314777 RepID=A0A164QE40_9AGAM|nr:hypothetical protein SISNIDRAFT_489021 [Sistotremastrum niveocremeum HHB9708]